MTRLLATGDSHLGKSATLHEGRLAEQEQVWRDTLAVAREHGCDAVLHAGDLFDARRPGPDVMLAAERPLVEHLDAGGCPVIAVVGNHDVPSQDGPCGLDVLAEAGLLTVARQPRSIPVSGMSICCLPWTPVHRLLAQTDGADRDEVYAQAADLLVQTARDLVSQTSGPAILLGHWAVTGASLPSGLDVGMLREVVLPLADLEQIGYDAMLFGHIHAAKQWATSPFYDWTALMVGSPMPLDHGEALVEHGCWLLTGRAFGFDAQFLPLPSRPFVTIDVDAAGVSAPWTQDIEGAIVRVRVTATEDDARTIDVAAIRDSLLDAGAHVVTGITIDVQREHRDRPAEIADDIDPAEALGQWLTYKGVNGQLGEAVHDRARTYLGAAR